VKAADDAGVTVMDRCLLPGYSRPGEKRVDVVTVLRAFGGAANPPKNLTLQLLTAARLSMSDASKVVTKLQNSINEVRRLRKEAKAAAQIDAPVPFLPLVRDAIQNDLVATDVEDESLPLETPLDTDADSLPTSGFPLTSAPDGDIAELPSVSPVPVCRATPDVKSSRRSVGTRSSQRPPTMPKRSTAFGSTEKPPEASPVPRRALFGNYTGASPSPSPSPSPRTLNAELSESSAREHSQEPHLKAIHEEELVVNEVEKILRQHLLKLGKNHIQSAFRVADRDCDNNVSADDVQQFFEVLNLAESEESKACLTYFGRGIGFKAFAAWIRGKVNASDAIQDLSAMRSATSHGRTQNCTNDSLMRSNTSHGRIPSSSDSTTSHGRLPTGADGIHRNNVSSPGPGARKTSADGFHRKDAHAGPRGRSTDALPRKATALAQEFQMASRARSTDGFPRKAAAMPAVESDRPTENASASLEPSPLLCGDGLEPVVRKLILEPAASRSTSAAALPVISSPEMERARSPAKLVNRGRSQSNASSRSGGSARPGSHGERGAPRSGSLRRLSGGGKRHASPA